MKGRDEPDVTKHSGHLGVSCFCPASDLGRPVFVFGRLFCCFLRVFLTTKSLCCDSLRIFSRFLPQLKK